MTDLLIRPEQSLDRDAVRLVNERAFGGHEEADLVEALHRAQAAVVALVAEVGAGIVGHILFSPVEVEHSMGKRLLGLAPMSVEPGHQKQGIGGRLVREGLALCRTAGADGVVVLGHAEYYPRFGFATAQWFGLRCEYDVPADVFMAIELHRGSLVGVSGLVRYHAAFAGV
jgi:putative acetyltransferase